MDDSIKNSRDLSKTHVENFIKNPLDKYINPKHLINYAIEKKRAKSLIRKIDRNFQVEEKEQPPKSGLEIYMTPEQVKRKFFSFLNRL